MSDKANHSPSDPLESLLPHLDSNHSHSDPLQCVLLHVNGMGEGNLRKLVEVQMNLMLCVQGLLARTDQVEMEQEHHDTGFHCACHLEDVCHQN